MANVPIRPLGAKFFGVFHNPLPGSGAYINAYSSYSFANYWQPQIDAIKAIGANFFVYFGSSDVVAAGIITRAAYRAQRRQVVEYAASLGLYVLSYATATFTVWAAGATNAQVAAEMADDAAMMSQYPNVIGYVGTDEPWASSVDYGGPLSNATIVSNLAAQYAAIKAAVPADFGVCCAPNPCVQSNTAAFTYSGAAQVRCDSVAAYCDFFVFHPFYVMTASEMAPVRTAYPGKQIMLSSSVLTLESDSSATNVARFASVMSQAGANDVRGMAAFLALDLSLTDSYGLFSSNGATPPVLTNRPLKTGPFIANNSAIDLRNHRVIRGKPRFTNFKQIGY